MSDKQVQSAIWASMKTAPSRSSASSSGRASGGVRASGGSSMGYGRSGTFGETYKGAGGGVARMRGASAISADGGARARHNRAEHATHPSAHGRASSKNQLSSEGIAPQNSSARSRARSQNYGPATHPRSEQKGAAQAKGWTPHTECGQLFRAGTHRVIEADAAGGGFHVCTHNAGPQQQNALAGGWYNLSVDAKWGKPAGSLYVVFAFINTDEFYYVTADAQARTLCAAPCVFDLCVPAWTPLLV